jgi:hypothetical protein
MPKITGSLMAEFFEKGCSGRHPVGVRTSADSIYGAADDGCGGFLMASSTGGLDAADCRLSEATLADPRRGTNRINFRLLLAPSTDVSVKSGRELEPKRKKSEKNLRVYE